MAVMSIKRNSFLSRFKNLLPSQNLYYKVGNKPRSYSDNDSTVQTLVLHPIGHPFEGHCRLLTSGPRRINGGPGARKLDRRKKDSVFEPGEINVSKWKKMDSRSLGITRTMVPSSPFTVLKILRSRGFEAYLVGGCVRDLLLKRTPRDFDVITTADLHQIRKQFHNCHIVGRKFPICRVHIKGSVIEVSSFKTSAKHSEDKEKILVSQVPRGCDKSDLNLWKNCMHRDFTVNSLFFDPVIHKIYDYSNGMKDLLELKLRTLVPAHLSFTEDCARILRGLRIAARLGLSFSKDTETAIHKQASSILNLSESRIMMEIDLMLSFGASESSLRLLHRFHILEILLPFQAAYINKKTSGSGECTMMLMRLFSHMDKFITCDRPSSCRLWIGLLAFHQALLDKPQDPFVVLTFASVLYHQEWQGGLRFARQCGRPPVSFEPELSDPCGFISDDELSVKVRQLALQVLDSIEVLVETDSMHKKMSKFPGFPCSGLIFIPKKSARDAAVLFHVLAHKVETYNKGRSSFEMNYHLLGKGDASETRFAMGKIILNTMGCGIDQDDDDDNHPSPSRAERGYFSPSDSRLQQPNTYNHKKQQPITKLSSNKKQNSVTEKKSEDGSFLELEQQKEVVFKQHIEALCDYSCPKMEAAYISQQVTRSEKSSTMLMNLLSRLDKLVACDRPSGSFLWIGILGFHMALVNNPQHPFVIVTFASVLYHQSWEDGLKFARKYGRAPVSFEPETLAPYKFLFDDEVAEKVEQLAMLVVDSIDVLVDTDSLNKTIAKFTGAPCSGSVFISKFKGNGTRQLFHVLAHKVETYEKGRTCFEINYDLLGKGDSVETRFVLGKIILDTMGCDTNEDNNGGSFSPKNDHLVNKKEDRIHPSFLSNLVLQQGSGPKKQSLIAKLSSIMQQRPPNQDVFQDELGDIQEWVSTKHTEVVGISSDSENEDYATEKPIETENEKFPSELEAQNPKEKLDVDAQVQVDHLITKEQISDRRKQTRPLSSLFK